MRFSKRLLLVLVAVVAAGIGFTSPSQAVTSPVITMVVDCARSTATSSAELTLDAPAGIYTATAVGACNVHYNDVRAITASTPCSVSGTPVPCVTASVSNISTATCATSLGAVLVDACAPDAYLTGCTFTVTVNGQCLIAGTIGQVSHGGGPVTARFEDSHYPDNLGYFVVTLRPAV